MAVRGWWVWEEDWAVKVYEKRVDMKDDVHQRNVCGCV